MTGFINVNKAEGVSSAREVNIIKRLTHTPCGHMGTLDPMASGVLPVAVGNACRLFDYFLTKKKTYTATFDFGADYDTLDVTGSLISEGGRVPSESEIISVLPSLCGSVMQIPPKYSAKKINGRRGYELARAGEDFDVPAKRVEIDSVELIGRLSENSFKFRIECGGGTYVRSICRDMAEKLGTVAAMSALVREKSGIFVIDGAISTDSLTEKNVNSYIIPTDSVLPYESIYPQGAEAKKLFNGVAVESRLTDGLYKIYSPDGIFYGLAEKKEGFLKVRTKLC